MLKLKNLYDDISKHLANKAKDAGHQLIVFGIVMFINFPLYYVIWLLTLSNAYENLWLRLLASLFSIPLIFKNYWPQKLVKFLPIYWYFTVLYCLPFFFTFMLLKNQGSAIWLMNSVSVLFFLLLLFDVISASILTTLGVTLGWVCYKLTTTAIFVFNLSNVNWISIVATVLAAFIIGAIFTHNKQKLEQEKLKGMAAVGGSIAHELRNPLLAINTMLNGIRKNFPKLMAGYQKADAHNLLTPEEKVRLDRFEALLTIIDDMATETHYANTMIDMLLLKVNPNIKSGETTICSVFDCIDDAMRRYPYNSPEQANLVGWDMEKGADFNFKGSQLLVVHVLFNLIKNALYFIADARKGRIDIHTECGEIYNKLCFRDTAKGIPSNRVPHLFTRFFSKTQNGTGLGLSFCKMVMTGMGGDIICRSQEGEYTEFILTFPKLNQQKVASETPVEEA